MNFNRLLMLTAYCALLLERRAFAYLDPGTGTYMFQIIMASFFGFVFVAGNFYAKIKGFLTGLIDRVKRKR